ncbi:MAG: hypothetical protein AB1578_21380 [Thermodesulfobacteriota bacterium]
MTYPDLYVATLLNEYFVPVQLDVSKETKLVDKYRAFWTPNLNVLDGEERMTYHVEGWLPAAEYSAMLLLALGRHQILQKRPAGGVPFLQEVMDKFPSTTFAPEALYYLGVAQYLVSHEVEDLVEGWKQLQRRYPSSSWALSAGIV